MMDTDTALLDFEVLGNPRPQGSMTPMTVPNSKRIYMKAPDVLYAWRGDVVTTTRACLPEGWQPLTDAVAVRLDFTLPRPKRHFDSKGVLRADAPEWVSNGSDVDKLSRALLDSLTIAGVFADDRHVSLLRADKRYVGTPGSSENVGVRVRVWSL